MAPLMMTGAPIFLMVAKALGLDPGVPHRPHHAADRSDALYRRRGRRDLDVGSDDLAGIAVLLRVIYVPALPLWLPRLVH